jgi:hypothetical protein
MMSDIAIDAADVKPESNARGWKFFADQKGAVDFIRCGQLLNDAKAELQTDAFSAMVKSKLAFDRSVGVKLMKIADKSALCAQAHNLPPCWATLYELAQLDDDILKAKLADGTIHPGMQRKDARALRCPKPRAETEASTNKGELLAAWKAATKDLRRRSLDAIGADALCEALSIPLRAELGARWRIVVSTARQQAALAAQIIKGEVAFQLTARQVGSTGRGKRAVYPRALSTLARDAPGDRGRRCCCPTPSSSGRPACSLSPARSRRPPEGGTTL